MVSAVAGIGLRVVLDVVYNHTVASGDDPRSVLDRIVPGYYHRLSATGQLEQSTCCPNTAAEHAMMEKLIVDSVLLWARQYRVGGFRFDLMGHHPRSTMLKVRAALDSLTVADRRRRRAVAVRLRRGVEFRRGREQRAIRAGHPDRNGRNRDRDVQRPAPGRRPRRRPVRPGPARAGIRHRPVHRPERVERRRPADGAGRCAAAGTGPDQGRADREPPRFPAGRPVGQSGHRIADPLRRIRNRVLRRARRRRHLRRRARQRNPFRHPGDQTAGGTVDAGPGADEHPVPGGGGAGPGTDVLARRAPTCSGRSRWTATRSTPGTGSTGWTGRGPRPPSARGCRPPRRTSSAGSCSVPCWPTPRWSRGRQTSLRPVRRPSICCGSVPRQGFSGSARPRG